MLFTHQKLIFFSICKPDQYYKPINTKQLRKKMIKEIIMIIVSDFAVKYSFNDILRDEPLGEEQNGYINKLEFEVYVTDIHGKL